MSAKHHNEKARQQQKRSVYAQKKSLFAKVWYFIWHDDSIYSWMANLLLAFVLIKFVIYRFLGLVLGADLPVVAVISGSMDHRATAICLQRSIFDGKCLSYDSSYVELCGETQEAGVKNSFANYWLQCGSWYEDIGIDEDTFQSFSFKNGFHKGDVIILKGVKPSELHVGDVLIFQSNRPYPIIHRVVKITYNEEEGYYLFATKGDHNPDQIQTIDLDEARITEDQIIGKGIGKIPFVGYVKIVFVNILNLFM